MPMALILSDSRLLRLSAFREWGGIDLNLPEEGGAAAQIVSNALPHQSKCHRKGSALTPNWVATGRQPYTVPGETTLAPVPMAMELESPPSSSIPSFAPRSASI